MGALALACGSDTPSPQSPPASPEPGPLAKSSCPSQPQRGAEVPDLQARHHQLETWVSKLGADAADRTLVEPEQVEHLNDAWSGIPGAWRDPTAKEHADAEAVEAALNERITYVENAVTRGTMVEGLVGSLAEARRRIESAHVVDHLRLAVEETPLFCVPLDSGLYHEPVDEAFDRNRCSSVHPGELVRVLRRSADGHWLYGHVGYTVGWMRDPGLTPRLSRDALDRWSSGDRVVPLSDEVTTTDGDRIRLGTSVPLIERTETEDYVVWVPRADGLARATIEAGADVHVGHPPLTRRRLWSMALAELGTPYGWGGHQGERDCSRFLRDLMATFGLQLARHSGVQAKLGVDRIDVSELDEAAKRQAIDDAAARGIVFLYMPGHIMMHLGRDGEHHYAISAISEYLEPCEGGPDTVHRLDRVEVTTLELGRDTERTAFIERITTIVVFGPEAASTEPPESMD